MINREGAGGCGDQAEIVAQAAVLLLAVQLVSS